jgi:hypothetical protein
MLAVRGIAVRHETVRQWGLRFGREIANGSRRRWPQGGDKWHLDERVMTIAGQKLTCGARSTRTASCSRPWFRADATRRQPNSCCASC